jgi:hypothetical protein
VGIGRGVTALDRVTVGYDKYGGSFVVRTHVLEQQGQQQTAILATRIWRQGRIVPKLCFQEGDSRHLCAWEAEDGVRVCVIGLDGLQGVATLTGVPLITAYSSCSGQQLSLALYDSAAQSVKIFTDSPGSTVAAMITRSPVEWIKIGGNLLVVGHVNKNYISVYSLNPQHSAVLDAWLVWRTAAATELNSDNIHDACIQGSKIMLDAVYSLDKTGQPSGVTNSAFSMVTSARVDAVTAQSQWWTRTIPTNGEFEV